MVTRVKRTHARRLRSQKLARALWPCVAEPLEGRLLLAQSPYLEVPFVIPATIQAEDFDNGGEGVAYHDITRANIPGQYRDEGVDVEDCFDVGGGYDVAYIDGGEWLEYTVSVPNNGNYDLELRLASGTTGGSFHVEFEGTNVTGSVAIPYTAGWQNWQTVLVPDVRLRAGAQVMRVVFEGEPVIANFNAIRISAHHTPFSGSPAAIPGIVQAEDFDHGANGVAYFDTSFGNEGGQYRATDRTTDVDIESTADADGGFNLGWMDVGEWLDYTVQVASAGTYDMAFRVASILDGTRIGVQFGGQDQGTLPVPNTGWWQTWQTIQMPVTLTAGTQVMRLYSPSGWLNLNWVKLSGRPSEIRGVKYEDQNGNGVYEMGLESGLSNWRIELKTLDGTTVAGAKTAWDGSYAFLGVPPGTYVVSEQMQAGWVQTAPATGSYTVSLAVGTKVSGKDFGNVRAAEIHGMKFNDLDLDGTRDATEPGLGGWTITLDRDGDGSIHATTTTAADGSYVFSNVKAGRYHVGEIQQTGWVQTGPVSAPYYIFDVQAGNPYYGIDFGNVLKGGIHGTVYDDVNDDGVRQGGETRLAGWTIMLRQSNGSLLTTTVTDGLGNYSFTDVTPGTYILTEVLQNGWVHTAPATDDQTVNLGSGATLTGVNFGNTVGALITFDDLLVGTTVTAQYLAKGVNFVPDPARTKAVIASLPFGYPSSSTQVADLSTPAGGSEFPIPRVEGRLLRTASQVSVYVGLTKPWIPILPNVVLTAYDANHNVVASAGPVQPDSMFKLTQLKVSSATASIVSFAISCDVNNASPVGIDDLRIITPTTSADFSLISAAASVNVGPGGSNTATINIIRLNGSAGNVQFSAAGLPPGVTASFTPNPASGNSTVLTLAAASNAPNTEYLGKTVTITGEPANVSVGPAPRSTTLQVVVRQNFTVSIAPGTVNMALGKSIPVQLTRLLDFTDTIQLQATGLPAGVSATFTPASMTPADFNYSTVGTSMMKLSATPTAPMTDFTGMVSAISGGESSTATFSIHRIPGVIDSISPDWIEAPESLKPGTLMTLKGDGFVSGSTVQFGASDEWATASYVSADYTELRVNVPRLATNGVLTVRTPTAREFKSSAAVTVNSYRNTHGYSFPNFTVPHVSWSTAEKLFGYGQMHWLFFPSPLAAIFVAIADSALDDGQCYGISRTTQQFMHGAAGYQYYPPFSGGSTIWGLTGPDDPSNEIWSYIHVQHIAQISAEGIARVKTEAWNHWVGDGMAHVKNDILGALQSGDHPLVSMLQGGTGHTVVAYDLENDPSDPNGFYIRVYDNNRPFVASENTNSADHATLENESRIHVTGGSWYFNLGGTTNWGGKMQSLIVTPYGEVPYQPTMPASLAGIWEMITGASGATTQVSDATGRFLLNPDGSMNEDPATRLPGALEYGLGVNPNAPPLFLLDSGGQYIQTVKGTGGGNYNTLLLGDGIGVNLKNVPSIVGVNDQLMIDTGANTFQFRTGAASKTFSVDLVAKALSLAGSAPGAAKAAPAGVERTVSISGTSFGSGGDTFGFDAARQRLIYTHQGPATAVTFTFTQPDDTGNVQTFAGQPIVLGAGDKAVFTPSDWDHLSNATVTMILTHANGSPVTQPLQRQSVLHVLELSTQLARPQGADLMVYPGSDDSGAPAMYPLGSISEIHVADGAAAILDKPGGGLIDLPLLSLEGSGKLRLLQGGDKLLRLAGLTLGPNTTLNLADNDLLISSADPAAVEAFLASAYNGGKWNRPGITTSSATAITTLGVFARQGGALVKYTYYGDMNGDGAVNLNDYFIIDSNYLSQSVGTPLSFHNGDVNLDNTINLNDYFLIDSAYLGQTTPLSSSLFAVSPPRPFAVSSPKLRKHHHKKPKFHQTFSSQKRIR